VTLSGIIVTNKSYIHGELRSLKLEVNLLQTCLKRVKSINWVMLWFWVSAIGGVKLFSRDDWGEHCRPRSVTALTHWPCVEQPTFQLGGGLSVIELSEPTCLYNISIKPSLPQIVTYSQRRTGRHLLGRRKKFALKIAICPKNKQFALKLTF